MNTENLPKRKNIRLKNYNYSSNGCYFITICTKNKKNLFGRYDVGAIHELPEKHAKNRCIILNQYGKLVENIIQTLPERYEEIYIDNYIVMPNHIHMLISINNDVDAERAIREYDYHFKSTNRNMWEEETVSTSSSNSLSNLNLRLKR